MMMNNFEIDTKIESPDLTPLIDVIFILLVFFLLTSTIQEKVLEIDIPESGTASQNRTNNELLIEIDRNNNFYYEGIITDIKLISEIIGKEADKNSNLFLTVRSDRETDFNSIIQILDAAKKKGIKGVNFSVNSE